MFGASYVGSSQELLGSFISASKMAIYLRLQGWTEFEFYRDRPDDLRSAKTPTREVIIDALTNAVKKSVSGDSLFVYWAGHGGRVRDKTGDERDGKDECIVPIDCLDEPEKWIRDDQLNTILVGGLAEGVRLRVVLDTCHAGSMLDLPVLWKKKAVFATEPESPSVGVVHDIVVISGCKDDKLSYIGTSGVLTTALCTVLKGAPPSWSWTEMGTALRAEMKRVGTHKQHPCMSSLSQEQLALQVLW
jgi:hypothetical protein